jgi:hypothetical protein
VQALALAATARGTRLARREFTTAAVMALMAGVAITISGCSSDYGMNPNPVPSTGTGDKAGTVSANHGHVAVVTAARIAAPDAFSLDIRGTADHTHTVALTSDQIRAIGAGTRTAMDSSTENAHNHTVTFNA